MIKEGSGEEEGMINDYKENRQIGIIRDGGISREG